jgi:hypothetical protein
VVDNILGGCAEPATREAMLGITANGDGGAIQRLRDLMAIAFASPEFQRR